jgi:hypothetical protein
MRLLTAKIYLNGKIITTQFLWLTIVYSYIATDSVEACLVKGTNRQ